MKQSYNEETAVVLFSGGQDSTTSLFWALKNFKKVSAISIDYGQKHSEEVETAENICKELGVEIKTINLSFMSTLVKSNLFEGEGDVNAKHVMAEDVPSSYVPFRNMLFLTIASAWATTLGAKHVVTGVCETDYSGYADCRDVFVKSLQTSLNLATDFKDKNVVLHTPLMWLTKAETFRMAEELDCLDFIVKKTLTCYNAGEKMHDYGRGCDECPACKLRREGYTEYRRLYS